MCVYRWRWRLCKGEEWRWREGRRRVDGGGRNGGGGEMEEEGREEEEERVCDNRLKGNGSVQN